DRDRRLKELEDKLEGLLKEIKDLRGSGAAPAAASTPTTSAGPKTTTTWVTGQGQNVKWDSEVTLTNVVPNQKGPITLSRASYKLPKEKAEALSAFMREHVKTNVLETKVEGDNFIVTTTPEAQHVIGQFVALIEGKSLTQVHGTSIYTTTPAP